MVGAEDALLDKTEPVVGSENVAVVEEEELLDVSMEVVDDISQALTQNLWPSSSLSHPVL